MCVLSLSVTSDGASRCRSSPSVCLSKRTHYANTVLRPQSKAICSLTDSKFSFWQARSHCPLPVCCCRFIAHQLPFCLLELSSCAAPYQRGLVCPPGRVFALSVLRASVISLLIAVLLLVSLVARALRVLWRPVQWIHSFTRTNRPPLERHYEHSVSVHHPTLLHVSHTLCAVGPGNWFLMFSSRAGKEKECIQTQNVFLFWTKATGACWTYFLVLKFHVSREDSLKWFLLCAWVMPSVTCTAGFFVDPVNTSTVPQFT